MACVVSTILNSHEQNELQCSWVNAQVEDNPHETIISKQGTEKQTPNFAFF